MMAQPVILLTDNEMTNSVLNKNAELWGIRFAIQDAFTLGKYSNGNPKERSLVIKAKIGNHWKYRVC